MTEPRARRRSRARRRRRPNASGLCVSRRAGGEHAVLAIVPCVACLTGARVPRWKVNADPAMLAGPRGALVELHRALTSHVASEAVASAAVGHIAHTSAVAASFAPYHTGCASTHPHSQHGAGRYIGWSTTAQGRHTEGHLVTQLRTKVTLVHDQYGGQGARISAVARPSRGPERSRTARSIHRP
jgi:hypothetical protein